MAGLLLLSSGCPPKGDEVVTKVALRLIAEGLTAPVGMAVPPDDSGRLFVIEQAGRIRILDADGVLLADPFLDIVDRMAELSPGYDERGLLGLAFHPDYAQNGRFFVVYNAPPDPNAPDPGFEVDSRLCLSEFRVSDAPNLADESTERILLEINKPQFNHNGGEVAFGPLDGFLYFSVGDGGAANDAAEGHNPDIGNGQDKSTLLAKMLRIDVDGGDPYAIPADNPFVDDPDARPEIWAFGLRNPWRFSFDLDDPSRMFIADVQQDLFEEVNLGQHGANYGWNIKEGAHCFDPDAPTEPPDTCPNVGAAGEPLIEPIIEYAHRNDMDEVIYTSVIGGFIYRGTAIPGLVGQYVFGDFSRGFEVGEGTLFAAEENAEGVWTMRKLEVVGEPNDLTNRFVFGFGQDSEGEVYVLTTENLGPVGTTGRIHQLVPAP